MLRKSRNVVMVVSVVATLLLAALACELPAESGPTVVITSPPSGSQVRVGEAVQIVSTSRAEAGVARVELTVNGVVVRRDMPPAEGLTEFSISQPWTPEVEGQATISVVVYDAAGASSPPAVIVLQVVGEAAGGVTPVPTSPGSTAIPPTDVPDVTSEAGCTLNASYVADITVPDNTEFAPGTSFVKTWRVRNSGTCDWTAGFNLVYVSGDQMGGEAVVAVPPTAAGSTVDLSIHATAPSAYGTYRGNWRMQSDEGLLFGSQLYVQIVVPEPATDTPPPTDTPLPTSVPTPVSTVSFTPVFTIGVTLYPILLPTTQQVYEQVSINPGNADYATASCPSGSIAVSGGYAAHPDVLVYSHFRVGNSWRAYAKNNAGVAKTLSVSAVCLHNTLGASVAQVSAQVTAPASGIGHPQVSCPAGNVVTGGGWAAYSDGSLHVYNSTKSGNGWQIYARNLTGSNKQVKVYAVCLSTTSWTTAQVGNGGSVPGNDAAGVVATCGGNSLAVGGGFAGGATLFIYNTSAKPSTTDQWNVYAKNTAGSNKSLNAYAVCLSFP